MRNNDVYRVEKKDDEKYRTKILQFKINVEYNL